LIKALVDNIQRFNNIHEFQDITASKESRARTKLAKLMTEDLLSAKRISGLRLDIHISYGNEI